MEALAPATTKEEFFQLLRTVFWEMHEKYDAKLLKREVNIEQLFITKVLSKKAHEYKQSVHQEIAAQQLATVGRELQSGMKISFLVTHSTAKYSAKRVIAKELYNGELFDMEWYRKMLREAFTNIIPPTFTEKDDKTHSQSLRDFITENSLLEI